MGTTLNAAARACMQRDSRARTEPWRRTRCGRELLREHSSDSLPPLTPALALLGCPGSQACFTPLPPAGIRHGWPSVSACLCGLPPGGILSLGRMHPVSLHWSQREPAWSGHRHCSTETVHKGRKHPPTTLTHTPNPYRLTLETGCCLHWHVVVVAARPSRPSPPGARRKTSYPSQRPCPGP